MPTAGYSIPAGTYKGQDEEVSTIGVTSVLVTSDSMSSDIIKQMTAMLFENAKDFSILLPWIFI